MFRPSATRAQNFVVAWTSNFEIYQKRAAWPPILTTATVKIQKNAQHCAIVNASNCFVNGWIVDRLDDGTWMKCCDLDEKNDDDFGRWHNWLIRKITSKTKITLHLRICNLLDDLWFWWRQLWLSTKRGFTWQQHYFINEQRDDLKLRTNNQMTKWQSEINIFQRLNW